MNQNDCQQNLAGNRDMQPEQVKVSGCVTGDGNVTVIDSDEVGGSSDGGDASEDELGLLSSEVVSDVTKQL